MNIYNFSFHFIILFGGIFGSLGFFIIPVSIIEDDGFKRFLIIPTILGVITTFVIWVVWADKSNNHWLSEHQERQDQLDYELMKKEREERETKGEKCHG